MAFRTDQRSEQPASKRRRTALPSCARCRRLKSKCTYSNSSICNRCESKGLDCISQVRIPPSRKNRSNEDTDHLEQRLDDLEAGLLAAVGCTKTQKSPKELLTNISFSTSLPMTDVKTQQQEGLNQDISLGLLYHPVEDMQHSKCTKLSHARLYDRDSHMCEALRALVPDAKIIGEIMRAAAVKWKCLERLLPGFIVAAPDKISNFVLRTLVSQKPSLVDVSKAILLVVHALMQLPTGYNLRSLNLRSSVEDTCLEYVALVDRFVTSDGDVNGSIETLEVLFMQAVFYTDIGKPCRAWLVHSRAIQLAQLMGLPGPSVPHAESTVLQRERTIWTCLCLNERNLSLMLGISSPSLNFPFIFADSITTGEASSPENESRGLVSIMGQIIRRNQCISPESFQETMRIEREMLDLAAARPQKPWIYSQQYGEKPEVYFERILVRFLFHHTHVMLHLPFMLKHRSNTCYSYSHSAALDSSRSLVSCFVNYRRNPACNYSCRTMDFQAFVSAMVILINLLDCGNEDSTDAQRDQIKQRDCRLIQKSIEVLRNEADLPNGAVVSQSVNTLDTMLQAHRSKQFGEKLVEIPYFGVLSVQKETTVGKSSHEQKNSSLVMDNITESTSTSIPALTTYEYSLDALNSTHKGYENNGPPNLQSPQSPPTQVSEKLVKTPHSLAFHELGLSLEDNFSWGGMPLLGNIGDIDFSRSTFHSIDSEHGLSCNGMF